MTDPLATATTPVFRTLARASSSALFRLHAERRAANRPSDTPIDLQAGVFDATFGRLCGGRVDDPWWRRLLNAIGHKYVAPDFLDQPALKSWLSDSTVQQNLIAIAKSTINETSAPNEHAFRKQLAEQYSETTGGTESQAENLIDGLVAILTAGYLASIPVQHRAMAGMIQAVSSQVHHVSDQVDKALGMGLRDPIVQRAHNEKAQRELDRVLFMRNFDGDRATRIIQDLHSQVEDGGELSAASRPIRNSVRYWAARLSADSETTLEYSIRLREQLHDADLDENPQIIDAVIEATRGNFDKAITLLRDLDDPDARSVSLSQICRARGAQEAVDWCEHIQPRDNPDHFTAIGWRLWALYLAELGRWEEAIQGLHHLRQDDHPLPEVAIVEGLANAAFLLPDEHRKLVLHAPPIYKPIAPSIDPSAKLHHKRATECLRYAETVLHDIEDEKLRNFISDWRVWIRLMDPEIANAREARQEIGQNMQHGPDGCQSDAVCMGIRHRVRSACP